jgi:hypothetical protein
VESLALGRSFERGRENTSNRFAVKGSRTKSPRCCANDLS